MWPNPRIKPSGFLHKAKISSLSSFIVTNLQFSHSVWLFWWQSLIFWCYSFGKGANALKKPNPVTKACLSFRGLRRPEILSDFLFCQQSASYSRDKGVVPPDEPSWDSLMRIIYRSGIFLAQLWSQSRMSGHMKEGPNCGRPTQQMRSHHVLRRERILSWGLQQWKK